MKKNNFNLFSALAFFVFGLIIFIDPNAVVKFISYCIGGLLILVGVYKAANYYIQDKRLGVVNRNEMAFGITAIILGIVFIFLASAIELLLRIVVGGYLILMGIGRIAMTFYTTDRTSKFYALIVVGLLLIGGGVYLIAFSNLIGIVGLFMMLYGLIDFVSYFVYKDKNDDKIVDNNVRKESKREEKVEEVELIETEEVKSTKSKKKKSK